jgi:Carbamoyl-phosphate synthase small chain, CPSase domain
MKLHEQDIPAAPNEKGAEGVLVLKDGTIFRGKGMGGFGQALGEVCFNTSMTDYQETEGATSRDHNCGMFSEHRNINQTIFPRCGIVRHLWSRVGDAVGALDRRLLRRAQQQNLWAGIT